MKILSCLFMMILSVFMVSCVSSHAGRYIYTNTQDHVNVPQRTIPIWIDDGFGEADRLAIDDAIRQWNYALNGSIVLTVVDNHFKMEIYKIKDEERLNGWLFMKINTKNKSISIPKVKDGKTLGFTNVIGGNHMYLVRDVITNDQIFGVVLHEIGHLLGSTHTESGLMSPYYSEDGNKCVDYDTIENVAKYQHIPIENLNYCVSIDESEDKKL